MQLEEQLRTKVKNYLQEEYGQRYGVDLELDSSEKEVELWIQCQPGGQEPKLEDLFSELGQPLGILTPSIMEEEYNEENNSYHLKIGEREEHLDQIYQEAK